MIVQKQKDVKRILPLIDEPKSFIIRTVTRVVSLTLIGLIVLCIVFIVTIFTVDINTYVDSFGILQPLHSSDIKNNKHAISNEYRGNDKPQKILNSDEWQVVSLVSAKQAVDITAGNTVQVEMLIFTASGYTGQFYGHVISIEENKYSTLRLKHSDKLYRVIITVDENQVKENDLENIETYPVKIKIITQSEQMAKLLWRYLKARIKNFL